MSKFRCVAAVAVLMAITVLASLAQTSKSGKKQAAQSPQRSHADIAADLEKALQDPTIPASARKELESLLAEERCEATIETTADYLKKAGLSAADISAWGDTKRKDPSCKAASAHGPGFDFQCADVKQVNETPQFSAATGIGKSPVVAAGTEYRLTALNVTGLEMEGPRNVLLTYVNRLRYDVGYSIAQTVILAPTPPSTFFPALPPSVQAGAAAPGELAPKSIPAPYTGNDPEKLLEAITQCQAALDARLTQWVVKPAGQVTENVAKAKASYSKVLEAHSNPILNDKEASNLYQEVITALPAMQKAIGTGFPSTQAQSINAAFTDLTARLDELSASAELKDWLSAEANKSRFSSVQRAAHSDIDLSAKYLSTTDASKAVRADQEIIAFWQVRFSDFKEITAPSTAGQPVNLENLQLLIEPPDCSTLFGNGSHNKISFTVSDLYKSSQQGYPDVLDVVCSPLLNVTGGFGFSTLPERTAGFLPGKNATTGTIEDQVTFTDKSSVRPAFAALVNVHFTSGHAWTPQLGVGTAVTNRGDTTNLEFLAGFGVTYKRIIYLTPAFHLGKVTELTGGITEGTPKGDLSQVPTRAIWRPGFALVITFPLPTSK